MTKNNLSRRFFPSISPLRYGTLPTPSLWGLLDEQWHQMENIMDTMMRRNTFGDQTDGTSISENLENKQLVYHDRSPEQEEFSIWTKGTYPKLNISKILNQDDSLKSLRIVASVPGFSQEQVGVNILGGEITIESGIKTDEDKTEEMSDSLVQDLVREIPDRYSKVIVGVTGAFDFDNATADFPGNGTLVVEIPAKTIEKEQPRKLLGK